MKIVHICPQITDGWSYQENYLSKYHARLGHNVTVIASDWVYNNSGHLIQTNDTDYVNDDGVKVVRLKIKNNKGYTYKFKDYIHLYETLQEEKPDIIFVHGCQHIYIKQIVKYAGLNKDVKIYVDNHADFSNSARTWMSRHILHGIIWKWYAHMIEPYTEKFYGVLPARVDMLKEVYKLPKNKCELLVMGADDDDAERAKESAARDDIRKKFGISATDTLIVTGGKIDNFKMQTLLLMEAVNKLKRANVKLIVFGSVADDMRLRFDSLLSSNVYYAGWIESSKSYDYFAAADIVVFPGRHSVMWEQVVGQGIPMIVKYWEGTTHVDIGGNVRFLYNDSVEEIINVLQTMLDNQNEYEKMLNAAQSEAHKVFLYADIAKRSIG